MYKIFFILISLYTFSNADSYYNKQCVIEYAVLPNTNKLAVYYANGTNWTFYDYDENILDTLVKNDGYFLFQPDRSPTTCYSSLSPRKFGLTDSQYNFMMALTGLLLGFMVSNLLMRKF
jgi:hypothetical protein